MSSPKANSPTRASLKAASPKAASPKADSPKAASPKAASPTNKRSAEVECASSPKKSKTSNGELQKQMEYYLSDTNLEKDHFFRQQISENAEGWVDIDKFLLCNKIKKFNVSAAVILDSLKESESIEIKGSQVRRKGNKSLPKATVSMKVTRQTSKGQVGTAQQLSKAHDGGVIIRVSNLAPETTWQQVRDAVSAVLPVPETVTNPEEYKKVENSKKEESDGTTCVLVLKPFDGDYEFCCNGSLLTKLAAVEAQKMWAVEVLQGTDLMAILKTLPSFVIRKREVRARERQTARNRPITLAEQNFPNVHTARQRVKEILQAHKLGSEMKPDSGDFRVVKAVLSFHPRSAEKMKDMKTIKVDSSGYNDNKSRCFHVVRNDGSTEDISFLKAFAQIEENPPYTHQKPQ